MKVLKALLAVFTTLAVALTAALLLWQDKTAPRYIHIYDNEEKLRAVAPHACPPPQPERPVPPGRGVLCFLRSIPKKKYRRWNHRRYFLFRYDAQ